MHLNDVTSSNAAKSGGFLIYDVSLLWEHASSATVGVQYRGSLIVSLQGSVIYGVCLGVPLYVPLSVCVAGFRHF